MRCVDVVVFSEKRWVQNMPHKTRFKFVSRTLRFVIARVTNFWPKNVKLWLYNLQILTLFWPINFLRLQLQNNAALGVEVNPEVYSYTLRFEKKLAV